MTTQPTSNNHHTRSFAKNAIFLVLAFRTSLRAMRIFFVVALFGFVWTLCLPCRWVLGGSSLSARTQCPSHRKTSALHGLFACSCFAFAALFPPNNDRIIFENPHYQQPKYNLVKLKTTTPRPQPCPPLLPSFHRQLNSLFQVNGIKIQKC